MATAQGGTELREQSTPQPLPLQDNTTHRSQMGSNSPTSTGITTPQPDPTDKLQPSIMNNYFQVGPSSGPKSTNSFYLPDPMDNPQSDAPVADAPESQSSSGRSSVSSESLVMMGRGKSSAALSDKKSHVSESKPVTLGPANLPTPPHCSAHSLLQKEPDETEMASSVPDKGIGSSIFTTLKSYLPVPSGGTAASVPESTARRHTSHPVSSISDNTVLASHFSNPCLPSLADAPAVDRDKPPRVSMSSENMVKLTMNAADASRLKNTPPLTPRAMSNDGTHSESHPTNDNKSPTSCPNQPDQSKPQQMDEATEEIAGKLDEVFPSGSSSRDRSSSPQSNPAVGSLKGKLVVTIAEARGLRPGFDPYVVCVFESNEVISKSAHDEEEASIERQQKEQEKSDLEAGRPIAIPMKSRQSSSNSLPSLLEGSDQKGKLMTDPHWNHEAVFDVLGEQSEVDVSVYDRSNQEAFLGHVRLTINLNEENNRMDGWYQLTARGAGDTQVSGEIRMEMRFETTDKKQVGPNDFQILKLIGKGTFGQVYQVKKKDTQRIYAMKVLSKKVIIQKKEVAHTLGERNILVRTAMAASPFIVGLKFSFQTPTDLYLVTDYMSGGELFWHLQKEGRFQEARAKFYIAELILSLQHLHEHDIVYRDLKPENILLDANGHIALCDFGLSKANLTRDDTTNTFCGTTEYLAPEVLLDEQGYTKMVDFWSLGVLVFEMCCGWSPFYAEDTQQMYKNIAFGKVRFPRDALSTEGRNFVKGLLNRNPKHRLGAKEDAKELMAHPFFADVDWDALCAKRVIPPFKPKLKSDTDTSNFDPEFTNAFDQNAHLNQHAAIVANGLMPGSTPLSPGMQANFKGFTFVNESSMDQHFQEENDDRMDEDLRMDDQAWQRSHRAAEQQQRISGVQKTGEGDPGIFHVDEHFDM